MNPLCLRLNIWASDFPLRYTCNTMLHNQVVHLLDITKCYIRMYLVVYT